MSVENNTRPYSVTMPTRWSDFDQYGHVNNTKYLDYAQEARFRWGLEELSGQQFPMSVVRTMTVDFLRPLRPDTTHVVVDTEIIRLGRTSYTLNQTIRDQRGDIAAEVKTVMVVVDSATQRPSELTAANRKMLAPYVIEELIEVTEGDEDTDQDDSTGGSN